MKLGLMADSHENMPMIAKAVELFNKEGVEIVFHAGDIISPITHKEFKNLKAKMVCVYGNNDGEKLFLKEKLGNIHVRKYETELNGKRILLIHEPDFLDSLMASGKYDLIIYGHTHRVDVRKGRTTVINPGECGGWLTGKPTVGIYSTDDDEVEIVDLTTV